MGIEVLAKHNILAFLLMFFKPVVVVDGVEHVSKWGTPLHVPTSAGSHELSVYFKYLVPSKAGRKTIQVSVGDGQTVRYIYKAPIFVFMPGKLKAV